MVGVSEDLQGDLFELLDRWPPLSERRQPLELAQVATTARTERLARRGLAAVRTDGRTRREHAKQSRRRLRWDSVRQGSAARRDKQRPAGCRCDECRWQGLAVWEDLAKRLAKLGRAKDPP